MKFDVVLSFSGDDRHCVSKLAKCLTKNGLSVFYDEREQTNLWGKNLYDYLIDVYRNKGRFCVLCISKSYEKKIWTLHELRSAQSRALAENYEYLLPIQLDDTRIPSLLDTVAHIDARKESVYDICARITQKIELHKVELHEAGRENRRNGRSAKRLHWIVIGALLVLYAAASYFG